MSTHPNTKLLKNRKVIEEINRHRWIESEKAGHDIGFEQASMDWLERFSKAWMDYHMPQKKDISTAHPKSSFLIKSAAPKSLKPTVGSTRLRDNNV
jgi:hypothetical protein